MHVKIELLRQSETILAVLRKDGWEMAFGQDGVSARHPQAADVSAARRRLHGLGLLISGSLRVTFCHTGPWESAEQGL
ncbi:MAG TPA: hypothetical protein VH643_34440 [Gemmataceae bacterium]|jgi:hypothetical protein